MPKLNPLSSLIPSIFRGYPGNALYQYPAESEERLGLIKRVRMAISAFRGRDLASEFFELTTIGGSLRPSPRIDLVERKWAEPYYRRRLIAEIDQLLSDDPLLYAGVITLTHGAVGDDFTLSIADFDESGSNRFRHILMEAVLKEAHLLMSGQSLASWAESFAVYGDVFIQLVVNRFEELVNLESMPVAGMERNSNDQDQFDDPARAFLQKDAYTFEVLPDGEFSDFQIVHGRHRRRPGDRYGRSLIFASRKSARDAIRGYGTLADRRVASHPKEVHLTKDKEGDPFTPMQLKQYISRLPKERLKRGEEITAFDYQIANGATDVKIIQGDPRFNELRDLESLVERELAPLKVPRSLIGGSPTVNWATLDKQREELFLAQSVFARHFEAEVIRPILDRALMLVRINPRTVTYQIDWGQRLTTEQLAAQANIAMEAFKLGLLSLKTATGAVLQYLGRKDVDAELGQIDIERKRGLLPQDS